MRLKIATKGNLNDRQGRCFGCSRIIDFSNLGKPFLLVVIAIDGENKAHGCAYNEARKLAVCVVSVIVLGLSVINCFSIPLVGIV